MTPQEEEALIQQNLDKAKKTQTEVNANFIKPAAQATARTWESPVDKSTAAIRGLASGATMGFQPQVAGALSAINPFTKETYSQGRDLAAARNEAAWQSQPGAYGAGYGAGALGSGLATAGVGDLVAGAKGASLALPAIEGAETAGYGAKALDLVKSGVGSLKDYLGKPIATKVMPSRGAVIQGTGAVTGNQLNQQQNAPLVPAQLNPLSGVPLSQVDEKSNQFATLANFLAQAKGSNNPDVQTAAEQAQAAIDPNDPDAKRKIAMLLQGTPEGRAVGNSDSSLNQA